MNRVYFSDPLSELRIYIVELNNKNNVLKCVTFNNNNIKCYVLEYDSNTLNYRQIYRQVTKINHSNCSHLKQYRY